MPKEEMYTYIRIKKRLREKKVVVQNCDDDDDASSRRGWWWWCYKVFQLSFSLSLSLFAPRWWCARAFFYSLSRAAFFLAFISLNFWAIMKDNSIA